jgi:hypothetical protein
MDALDQRINSNTLLLALETDSDIDSDVALEQLANDWINDPLFPTMLNEAEQLRQRLNNDAKALRGSKKCAVIPLPDALNRDNLFGSHLAL